MKKQTSLLLSFILLASVFKSQSWTTSGNSVGAGAFLGTTSNHALNFHTNGTKKASISTSGVFNVGGLAGTGSRFLQVNSTGDLVEWTGNSGATGDKILSDNNTWKTWPFLTSGTNYGTSAGTKLGVGVETPSSTLDVNGDIKTSGKIMLSSTSGISYNSTDNVLTLGKQSSGGNSLISPCYTLPAGLGWTQDEGFRCVQVNPTVATQVNAAMRMYVSPSNGAGYIEIDGVDNTNSNNVLNINTNCGRNTNINTGANGGNVNIGSSVVATKVNLGHFVTMVKHLEIGDASAGILSAPTNLALDLHVNSGKGLRVRTTSNNGTNGYNLNDMITVEANSTSVFNVNSDGKTIINCSDATALTIKHPLVTGSPETFKVHSDGFTEIFSYNGGSALTVYDGSTSSAKFEVLQNGQTSIKTSNTKAFSISSIGSSSTNETFSIDKSGYTEIKVYSPSGMPSAYGQNPRVMTIRDMATSTDIFVVRSNGKVYAREVEISLAADFPDYVFNEDYKLRSIKELGEFIQNNKHLPGFEKGEYYEKNGINVNSMILKQQEKIEELTLYIIQLEKRLQSLEK